LAFPAHAHRSENRRTADVEARFRDLVGELTDRYTDLWWETPADPPVLGPAVPRRRQRHNFREAKRLIDWIASEIERYPDTERERLRWRERVRESVQELGEQSLGWPSGYRDLLFAEDFFMATATFVRSTRTFDRHLGSNDLGQALRNVWITNLLQTLLDLPVRTSQSIFAYSMLYPYTDNFLDDPQVPVEDKRAFNRRLRRRLAGEPVETSHSRERRIHRLVGKIEDQYSRREFPELFQSLVAIHRAQVRSLGQQRRRWLPESELLSISLEKGGTSVLADGYLAAGALSRSEATFCFGYGVFLQLLDDLQDVQRDVAIGHTTLFSRTAGASPLDGITGRLHGFMCTVLESTSRFGAPRYDSTKDLIRRSCNSLIVNVVSDTPKLFTPSFLRALEARWPFDLASLRKLRKRIDRRCNETARTLRRRRGIDSLLDLFLPAGA
jgi:hypothetical protein